jgi:hypothetical protein
MPIRSLPGHERAISVSECESWPGNRDSASISTASESLRRPESMPAGTLAPAESQCHGGCDHGQARQLSKCRHAGADGTIIRGLSSHRCSDPCCSTARNKLKTVAPAVVLYPPRNTAPNVALRAFPARVPAARSRIQNMNVNPFVLGHYAEVRFCFTGATVTGGRTGVLWKSLDKFWALPLGLRVCPQGTTGERGSFGGCALRLPVEPRLHRKYTQGRGKA